jgi:hypothetical protein
VGIDTRKPNRPSGGQVSDFDSAPSEPGASQAHIRRGEAMRIHQWQLRGHDRTVKEVLRETAPTMVGHGIIGENDALFDGATRGGRNAVSRVPEPG